MMAVVFTEGATSPGSHDRTEAITDSGYLMPGRLLTFATPDICTAPYSRSAACGAAVRRSDWIVTCGMASTSWCRKSICEPSISPAIMMVKPTPMATPAMPTSVCRTRVVTWVQAMLTRRLEAIPLTSDQRPNFETLRLASLTTESMWAEIAVEIVALSTSAVATLGAAGAGADADADADAEVDVDVDVRVALSCVWPGVWSGVASSGAGACLLRSVRTRVPSARSGRAGESTAMPRDTSPITSTLRLP